MTHGCTGTNFIGSFVEEPGHAVIVLRGDVDAFAVIRVGVHIQGLHAVGVRFLLIDGTAVDRYDAALLDLLGRVRRRLRGRHGTLRVHGLHPSLLAEPVPDPVAAGSAPPRHASVPRGGS